MLALPRSIHGSPLPQRQFVPSIFLSNLRTSCPWLPRRLCHSTRSIICTGLNVCSNYSRTIASIAMELKKEQCYSVQCLAWINSRWHISRWKMCKWMLPLVHYGTLAFHKLGGWSLWLVRWTLSLCRLSSMRIGISPWENSKKRWYSTRLSPSDPAWSVENVCYRGHTNILTSNV